jgi:hypothetical protein
VFSDLDVQSRHFWSGTSDSAPSEARNRGSGGGSPRKHDDLLTGGSDLVTARRAKRENGDLGEDAPGSTITILVTTCIYSLFRLDNNMVKLLSFLGSGLSFQDVWKKIGCILKLIASNFNGYINLHLLASTARFWAEACGKATAELQ